MIIITVLEEKLKRSKYYNEDCWDYPLEEIEYLSESKDNNIEGYALTENNRIYETICTMDKIKDL